MTGYLTQRGRIDSKTYELAVPNLEIRDIITTHVLQIDDKGYAESFYHGEVKRIIKYGIACFRKQCRVAMAVENV